MGARNVWDRVKAWTLKALPRRLRCGVGVSEPGAPGAALPPALLSCRAWGLLPSVFGAQLEVPGEDRGEHHWLVCDAPAVGLGAGSVCTAAHCI